MWIAVVFSVQWCQPIWAPGLSESDGSESGELVFKQRVTFIIVHPSLFIIVGHVKATGVMVNFLIYMCNASGYKLPKNKMPSNISDTKEYTRVVFIGHKALSAHWNTCKCQSIAAFGSQICAEKAMRSCCSKSGTECRKQHGRERLESEKEI